jgi:hypothetical protein
MAFPNPPPPPDELDKGFLTYANYAAHVAGVIRLKYGSTPCHNIADTVRSAPAVQRIQRRRGDIETDRQNRIALHARQAWATETRLRWSAQQDTSLTPFLLPGAPGDAYYAVYHGYLALLAARGNDMPTDHAATRHSFASDVCERRIFPYPWSVACKGPSTPDDAEWVGLPDGSHPIDVSNLSTSTPSNARDGLCKVIRITRSTELEEARDAWLKRNARTRRRLRRTRLGRGVPEQLARESGATTVLGFLYRLRTRCDYRDIQAFVDGAADGAPVATAFLSDLASVVEACLTVFETLIVRYINPAIYDALVTETVGKLEASLARRALDRAEACSPRRDQ